MAGENFNLAGRVLVWVLGFLLKSLNEQIHETGRPMSGTSGRFPNKSSAVGRLKQDQPVRKQRGVQLPDY